MKNYILSNIRLVTPSGVVENAALWAENGLIRYAGPADNLPPTADGRFPRKNANGAWAVPAFIDLHIHGFGGFGPELGTPEALLEMSQHLARQGVGAFCPTLYCARPEQTQRLLCALAPAVGKETGAQILGFHLEGPFISPAKPGVMKPQDISAPDVSVLERFWQAAQGHLAAMTLAPELTGLGPVIDFCKEHHILMQAGHTDATYAQMAQAAGQGITHVTHLFNAMRPLHHREPAAVGYVLTHREISCEIIADGFHVRPEIISFLREIKPVQHIIAVTDALLPTGQTQPPFIANGEEVFLDNGVWKRKADGVIAGSALTMHQALKNLVAWGYPLVQAVLCTATNAADRLQKTELGRLEIGAPARIVLLDKDLNLQEVLQP